MFPLFDIVMVTVDSVSEQIGESPTEDAIATLKRRCDIIDKAIDKRKYRRTIIDYDTDNRDIIIRLSKGESIRYTNLWGNS